jgi:transcription antitermination factor NusG
LSISLAVPNPPWVALVVRPQAERRVEVGLNQAGLETFVPWHNVRRRWSDRVKVIQQNLFSGYLFCRSEFSDRRLVLSQPGVESVVSFDRSPALIPDDQIAAVRLTLQSGLPVGPWPFLKTGQRVRIERGVLAGLEGSLARDPARWRVIVSVQALERSVAVEVDRDMIRPL